MPISFLKASLVVLLSGLAYYYGQYFHFQWWLIWLAPIPLLIYVWRENFWLSLVVTLLVGLIAGLNEVVGYYESLPTNFMVTGAIIEACEWTLVILLVRFMVRLYPSGMNSPI